MAAYELPMFPLEHPVVPTAVVPLHIFEPRYRALARQLAAADEPEFGIIGIERGREVGGHDERADVGVVARVLEQAETADGRWALVAVGTRRIRVGEWLADDPYPRAMVTDAPDPIAHDGHEALAALVTAFDRLVTAVRSRDPQAELPDAPAAVDDPGRAGWEIVNRVGLGPLDLLRLLRTDDPADRARLAAALLDERRELVEALDG